MAIAGDLFVFSSPLHFRREIITERSSATVAVRLAASDGPAPGRTCESYLCLNARSTCSREGRKMRSQRTGICSFIIYLSI